RFARRQGMNLRRAIVVGGGAPAVEILGALRRRPDIGVHVLGLVGNKQEEAGAPWLGGLEDLRPILDRRPVGPVLIALPHGEDGRLGAILTDIGDDPVAIHLVPDVYSLVSMRGGIEEFEGVPVIHLRESPLHGWNRVLKRTVDVVVGGAALLALA